MGQEMLAPSVDRQIEQLSGQGRDMVNKLLQNNDVQSIVRPQHASYISPLGKINKPERCKDFDFLDPQSEVLLKDSNYNGSIGFKEQILQIFYNEQFTYEDLREAIQRSVTEEEHLKRFYEQANKNIAIFMNQMHTDLSTASACCLVISYYTGFYNKTFERNSSILIKLESMNILECIKRKKQLRNQICIGYWMLKAISYLPLYVNQATRCINLTEEETQYYAEGNLITWLQFSSSSEEKFIPFGYEKRNTRFHIYSITARKISDYSNFGQAEKEVLFRPFTHFMILKKEKIDNILHIYMRQIAIGQAKFNVLWVDDKIFQPSWQHKSLVETIIRKNPRIAIIPKCSKKLPWRLWLHHLEARERKVSQELSQRLQDEMRRIKLMLGLCCQNNLKKLMW